MLAHYNVDENSFHGLDHLAAHYFNAMEYDIPLEEKHGFGPLERHCEYLGLDVYFTRKLYFTLKRELHKDPLTERLFNELTMPAARMYAHIEQNGVYIDPKALAEAKKYWTKISDEKCAELNRLVPSDQKWKDKDKVWRTGINWGSPQQVAEVLFKRLKLSPLDKTPKGADAVNESVLLRLADQHPVPKLILEAREADKNLGTFIEGWANKVYNNNRLHGSYKLHGTVTGRPSMVEPNLQQTPRDPRLRSIIRAQPGWTLVDADLSQAELRIAAEMSGDRELKLSYQTGVDVHTLTCQRIFGILEPTKEERKRSKAINFGYLYGMWWKKFKIYARDKYGVEFSDAESKRSHRGFFNLYQGLHPWHKRQKEFARRNGYVRSLCGRKRRLPDAMRGSSMDQRDSRKAEAERQAINSPVQSFVSDWNLAAAIELHEELSPDYFLPVVTVHDANLMEVRNDMLKKVLPRIKQAMEQPKLMRRWGVKLSVPIVAELELGPWGAAEVWDEH